MLLSATLDLAPSVNGRTIYTSRGGYEAPHVTAYKWIARNQLQHAWQDSDALREARLAHAYLSVRLWACLPAPNFALRDIDNMLAVPINVLKEFLGIDDSRIIDLHISKHLLPAKSHEYLIVEVSTALLLVAPHSPNKRTGRARDGL